MMPASIGPDAMIPSSPKPLHGEQSGNGQQNSEYSNDASPPSTQKEAACSLPQNEQLQTTATVQIKTENEERSEEIEKTVMADKNRNSKSPKSTEDKSNSGSGLGRNLNLISCEECGLICAGQSHYQVHIRSHTGERPFKCTICGVAFTQKGNLRRHFKIHSDEKPFQCPVCSYRCRRRDALNGHMRIHSDIRPYQCIYCARSYKSRQSLKEHEMQCNFKQDPVLKPPSPSDKQKQGPDINNMMSLGYRSLKNGAKTQTKNAYHAAMAVLAESLNTSSRNSINNLSSINPQISPIGMSKYSPASLQFGANASASSGKRKCPNPQKIPQVDANYSNYMMNATAAANPYFFNRAGGDMRPSPLQMLSFVPPTVLNSMLYRAAEAAKQPAQDEALDFSAKSHSSTSGTPKDDDVTPNKKLRFDFNSPSITDKNLLQERYDEKLSPHKIDPQTIFGSAKRKRPKYLNERYLNNGFESKSVETDAKDKCNIQSDSDDGLSLNSTSPNGNLFDGKNTSNTSASRSPSPATSASKLAGDAANSGIRVYKMPKSIASDSNVSIEEANNSATELKTYLCRHCKCLFMDHVMYTIHAGCHGFRDPYECNVCGFKATDRYQFQSHITRGEHFGTKDIPVNKSPQSFQPSVNSGNYTASVSTNISPGGYADFISKYEDTLKKRATENPSLYSSIQPMMKTN